jgi:hypothetical protein
MSAAPFVPPPSRGRGRPGTGRKRGRFLDGAEEGGILGNVGKNPRLLKKHWRFRRRF